MLLQKPTREEHLEVRNTQVHFTKEATTTHTTYSAHGMTKCKKEKKKV